mmetsp:Transcript_14611/g.39831  ORF Transcript_14611/g.39831 Transcript_14611/m.39831 type:complete len:390 (+) Transcript_14611:120-1289(+)
MCHLGQYGTHENRLGDFQADLRVVPDDEAGETRASAAELREDRGSAGLGDAAVVGSPAEEVPHSAADHEATANQVADDGKKEVGAEPLAVVISEVSTVEEATRDEGHVGDAMLVADDGEDHDGEEHSHQTAGNLVGELAEQHRGAHQSVGGDSLEEANVVGEAQLALSSGQHKGLERLLLEQIDKLHEEVHVEHATAEVGEKNKEPVVDDLDRGHATRKETDSHDHGIASEQLSAEQNDQKDSNREEKTGAQLGEDRPKGADIRGDATTESENQDNSNTNPQSSKNAKEIELAERERTLVNGSLLLELFNVGEDVDLLRERVGLDLLNEPGPLIFFGRRRRGGLLGGAHANLQLSALSAVLQWLHRHAGKREVASAVVDRCGGCHRRVL